MDWRLILGLSSSGLLIGAAATLGWTRGIEGFLWLGIGLLCALVLALRQPERLFAHAFRVGLIATLLAAGVEALFFPWYVQHYPEFRNPANQPPLDPRLFLLFISPLTGAASGAVLGFLTLIADGLLHLRNALEVRPAQDTGTQIFADQADFRR